MKKLLLLSFLVFSVNVYAEKYSCSQKSNTSVFKDSRVMKHDMSSTFKININRSKKIIDLINSKYPNITTNYQILYDSPPEVGAKKHSVLVDANLIFHVDKKSLLLTYNSVERVQSIFMDCIKN